MRTHHVTRHHHAFRIALACCSVIALAGLAVASPDKPASAALSPAASRPGPPIGSVCLFSHRANDDPIVHPGMPGMAHSHDFFGNVSTNARSTDATLAGAGTSCRIAADRAAYWLPTLMVNDTANTPSRIHAYYQQKVLTPVAPPPPGLRIIAGGTPNTVVFSCMRGKMPTVQRKRPTDCSAGGELAIGIKFPDCWNGVDLDSADHRSHMAYSARGACPDSHPVALTRLLIFAVYPGVPDGAALAVSSGPLGTIHADFVNAWDQDFLTRAVDYCLHQRHSCQKRLPRALSARPLANY